MTDELIYLAAPYSDSDFEYEWQRYDVNKVITANMILAGDLVYSPILHSHHLGNLSAMMNDYDWYAFDLRMLRKCDKLVVLMLDGWRESKGVKLEIAEAQRLGMPIEYREA